MTLSQSIRRFHSLIASFEIQLTLRLPGLGELAHWQEDWLPPRSLWSGSSGWSRCGLAALRGPRRRRRSALRRERRLGRRWRRRWRWGRRAWERGAGAGGAGTQTSFSPQCECLPGKVVRATVERARLSRWSLLLGWPLAPTWPTPMEFYMFLKLKIYVFL